jgi:prepilin-type N-terminal cleavage/methylation domain-containing protein
VKAGFTLIDLILALAIAAILAAVAVPTASRFRDGLSVRAATGEAHALFGTARHLAILRARMTVLDIDTVAHSLLVRAETDTLRVRPLGLLHGVRLEATRLTTTYAPNGVGYGLSNLTLVVRRGRAADTLTVSRLGRVRR